MLEIVAAVQAYAAESTPGQAAAWKTAHPREARIIHRLRALRRQTHE